MPRRGRSSHRSRLKSLAQSMRPQLKLMVGELLRGRLADKLDPSDVVQQGLAVACEQIHRFEGQTEDEFGAWVASIVRHETLNTIRFWKQGRRDVRRERSQQEDSDLQPADYELSPSGQVIRNEQVARLLALLDDGPADEREALQMRYIDGASLPEIAQRLDRTRDSVSGLLRRAIQRLRTRIQRRQDRPE
ncbi:MAG: sigma-70 family RNA polymerase sigma factor [Planctomycetes bacterium]|nr:sigma-70 family RNA polymerase sigma factor [Planctomycetota bacterium]